MSLILLGLNHRSAPVEIRERFDFSGTLSNEFLPLLAKKEAVNSGLILSTCNRVEIYATGRDAGLIRSDVFEFLRTLKPLNEEELNRFFYRFEDREAVRHLFRVASSLDSLVVGEPQILGQVKEAYFSSSALDFTDPFLDRLMQKTFSVAKRIRTETAVGQQAASVSYAAVQLAGRVFGDLKGKTVLVLGAGEMAELAARHLKKEGLKEVIFANRSYEHSAALAQEYGGIPVPFGQFEKYLSVTDIAIVSTAAPHFLITKPMIQKALACRLGKPVFLIDISVPRNVDPAVAEMENAYLFNIDDLQQVVESNLKVRNEEATKAEAIVEGEVEQFYRTIQSREAAPLIVDLKEKYEDLRLDELKRLFARLPNADEKSRSEIERSLQSLVNKILNDPILYLKAEEKDRTFAEKEALLRRMFGLGSSEKG